MTPGGLSPADEQLLERFDRLLRQLRSFAELQAHDLQGRGQELEKLAQIHAGELQIAADELADLASDVRDALERQRP